MAISLPLGSGNSGTNDWSDVYNNDAQLVTEFDDRDGNYQTLLAGTGIYAALASATSYFTMSVNLSSTTGPATGIQLFYFASADFAVASKTQKLRMRAQQATTGAPGTTMTAGLYPVTAVGAGVTYTVGSVISGSTVPFATTAGSTLAQANSGDFTIPSDGYYIVGVASSGATASGSNQMLSFQLQTRWV